MARKQIGAGLVLCLAAGCASPEPRMTYPPTKTVEHVDTYHGVAVPDPYRWLEDDRSAETAAWVEAQNAVTFAHLETIPFRARLTERLEQLFNYPKYSEPVRRGATYFFSKNDGLQNQAVIYTQTGLDGPPEVLLDPNALSPDGTTKLAVFSVSNDGALAIYGLSEGGSDWLEYRVLDVATRQPRRRRGRVGEGLGRGLGRRRLLLQPLSRQRSGQGPVGEERRSPGVLSPRRHAAVGRRARLQGPGAPGALPHGRGHRRRALRRAHRVGPGPGQEGQRAVLPGPRRQGLLVPADRGGDRRRLVLGGRQPRRHLPRADRPPGPQRPRVPVRPEASGREPVARRAARTARAARRRGHRRRQAVCGLSEGRHLAGLRVRHGRQAGARDGAARSGHGGRPGRPPRRPADVLHLHVVQLPADHLPLRHGDGAVDGVPQRGHPRLHGRGLRREPGVRGQQGRHQGADVPHPQEGPATERPEPDPDVRLRRLQRQHRAGLQRLEGGAARAGLRLRLGQPARRRRIRRGLACGRHEAAEAERVRRFHRRGRMADREQVHDDLTAGYDRRLERGAAGGRGDEPAAGAVCRGRPAGGRDGHAALPQVHHRLELDCRLRLERQRRRVQGALRLFAAAQPRRPAPTTRRRSSPPPTTTTGSCRRTRSSTPRRCSSARADRRRC